MQLLALDVVGGVPAHPLLVHIPVVMIPLALILAASAFVTRIRTTALWGATGSAVVGLIGSALSGSSGEALQNAVQRTDLLRAHTQAGELVTAVTVPFVLVLVVALAVHLSQTESIPVIKSVGFAKKVTATMFTGILALTSILGLVASWKVYDAGHSGAKSAWRDVDVTKIREGEGDDD